MRLATPSPLNDIGRVAGLRHDELAWYGLPTYAAKWPLAAY
jgi:hypothetical protein